jgi:hypothetical protein
MSGIPAWARVGAKVVCVDTAGLFTQLDPCRVYTIAEVYDPVRIDWGIRLVEVASFVGLYGAFFGRRFRPAVPPKTEAEDTAQFRKLLNTTPVRENA